MNLKILLSGLIVQLSSLILLFNIKFDDRIFIFYVFCSIWWWIFLICNPGFGFYENKMEIVIDRERIFDMHINRGLSDDINNFISIYNKNKNYKNLKIYFESVPYKVNQLNAIFECEGQVKYTCTINNLRQLEKYKNVWWEYKKE